MNALWPWKVAVVFNTGAELLQKTDTRFVLCHPGKSLLLLGAVDVCCTNFVLNGSVLISKQLCRPSGSASKGCDKE